MTKTKKLPAPVAKNPVARFYYQGTHSHPVRRTVLVLEDRPDCLIGYEIREGGVVRPLPVAGMKRCVKRYNKAEIARWGDYSRLTKSNKASDNNPNRSTLQRASLTSLFTEGA